MGAQETQNLAMLKAQRDNLRRQIRKADQRIGELADKALSEDKYASKSSIGKILGVSHTQVSNLIEAARRNQETNPAVPGVPVMDNTIAGDYVLGSGAKITRSVSAFTESDTLFQSGLDPRMFADESGHLDVPDVLWQLDDGEWVGVSQATVGYGGTGCDYTHQALTRAGVDTALASEIVSYRFCDADLSEDPKNWDKSDIWPRHARSMPLVLEDRIIVPFGEALHDLSTQRYAPDMLFARQEADETGFYPSTPELTSLEAWIAFLNDEASLPDWATGPRVARVFRSTDAALADGFVLTTRHTIFRARTSSPCVVIEQGKVQLWGHFYRAPGDSAYLPDEGYEALALADIYPDDLKEHDRKAARPLSRFSRQVLGLKDGLPDTIDVSPNADLRLSFTPTMPLEY